MPQYKAKAKTESKPAQTGNNWNDNIQGEMTVYSKTFKGKTKDITKYSTRLYRKLKDSEEYINHYINVAFLSESLPDFKEDKAKINIVKAFMSLDYYTDKDGVINYNPTIYVQEWTKTNE